MKNTSSAYDELVKDVARRETERAKALPAQERGLMETLLAADVPFERAVSLISDKSLHTGRAISMEHAYFIREHRMTQFPEGSAVRRRLGMIADMLDPTIENAHWDYGQDE